MNHTPPETKRISEDVLRLIFEKKADEAEEPQEPDDFRDMLRFGLLTGLRPLELRNLTKDNVRQTPDGAMFLLIERHKTSRPANEPKPRTVPLSPPAKEILQRQLASHPKSDYVFLNDAGTPYTRYSLKTKLKRLCQKLGIKVFSPYALRHTFASMESDGNIETTSLSHLMGHSSTRTVQRYISNTYAHHQVAVDTLAERVESIIQSGKANEKEGSKETKVG